MGDPVDDYVPLAHRERTAKQERARYLSNPEPTRQELAEGQVRMLLARLGGRDTDCYLEIVKRTTRLRAFLLGKHAVQQGRALVYVAEVLPAYTVGGVIGTHRVKTDGARSSYRNADAYVAADGRLSWGSHPYGPPFSPPPGELAPRAPGWNVHQVERCSTLADLTEEELRWLSNALSTKASSLDLLG